MIHSECTFHWLYDRSIHTYKQRTWGNHNIYMEETWLFNTDKQINTEIVEQMAF